LLGDWLARQCAEPTSSPSLTAGSYHRLLREIIVRSSIRQEFLEQEARNQSERLFAETYAVCGKLAVEELNEPFDVLVMDEAQDLLEPGVLEVLNAQLKGGLKSGAWAVFGDFHRQAIFGLSKGEELKRALSEFSPNHAKGRLTFNCRNTRNIGEETALLSGFPSPPYRMGQVSGPPVDYRFYRSAGDQSTLLRDVLKRLLAGGVKPAEIAVLSPLRLANSGVADLAEGSEEFRLVDAANRPVQRARASAISFATAQAFKGMESPVVVLCDIEQVGDRDQQSLLYVAMSRARSHLSILANERTRATIVECVRRRLEESWKKAP
jgi:superfamily I DNA/RNA helicase